MLSAEILNNISFYILSIVTLIVFVLVECIYQFNSLTFDNTYISRKMIVYDSQQSSVLFPLRKAEKKKFVNCLSPALSPSEKKSSFRNNLLI